MHNFVKRALEKIEQLDIHQIVQLIKREDSYISTLEQVLDNLSQGIILLNSKKNVVYINKEAISLPPIIRKNNYEGLSIFNIVQDSKVISFLNSEINKLGYNEEDNEFDYQWGDDIRTIVLNVIKLSEIEEIEDNGFLLVFDDITIRKRNETRLRRSENLASMTTMAAGVAHEIKNPLAAMSI
ncbi:MAG: histidine kinase, partial [Sphaerochaetaceae bacterium]|nr:histidine kinase [Sphaerochaetaceae bacterium]